MRSSEVHRPDADYLAAAGDEARPAGAEPDPKEGELALTESIDTGWATSVTSLDPPGDELVVRRRRRARYGESIAGEVADCLFLIQLHRGKLDVEVAGPDAEAAARGLEAVRRAFPRQGVDAGAHTAPVNFWHRQEFGEDGDRREMELVTWDEVAGNYAPATRLEMERLVRGYRPGAGVRLFLWHGPPGTGKTYALRALAMGVARVVPPPLRDGPGGAPRLQPERDGPCQSFSLAFTRPLHGGGLLPHGWEEATMALDEELRHRIHTGLARVIGDEEAAGLMDAISSADWERVARKDDLRAAEERLGLRLDAQIANLRTDLIDRLGKQATSFTRTTIIALVSSMLTMTGIAFTAAGLR